MAPLDRDEPLLQSHGRSLGLIGQRDLLDDGGLGRGCLLCGERVPEEVHQPFRPGRAVVPLVGPGGVGEHLARPAIRLADRRVVGLDRLDVAGELLARDLGRPLGVPLHVADGIWRYSPKVKTSRPPGMPAQRPLRKLSSVW